MSQTTKGIAIQLGGVTLSGIVAAGITLATYSHNQGAAEAIAKMRQDEAMSRISSIETQQGITQAQERSRFDLIVADQNKQWLSVTDRLARIETKLDDLKKTASIFNPLTIYQPVDK